MSEPIVSFWRIGTGTNKRWVCQARIRPLGQKPISVQRRHAMKTVAFERALEALSLRTAPNPQIGHLTAREMLEKYLISIEGTIKETTIGEYAYQLDRYFCQTFGAREISTITPDELRTKLKELLDQGLSVATVNTVRTRISGLYNFALREQLAAKNPAALVRPFRSEAGKPSLVQQPWNLAEIRQALLASRGDALHLFLTLCIFTGLRRGEVAGLSWGDFNESEKTLKITKSLVAARAWSKGKLKSGTYLQSPKTASSARSVYCSDEVLKAIYKTRRSFVEKVGRLPSPEDPMIFGNDGKRFDPSSIGKRFKKFCDSNEIRRIRVHDLRHTSAVLALEAGIPLEAVSEGLGHSGIDITKRIYAPKVPGLGKKFSAQLDKFLVSPISLPDFPVLEESHHA